MSLLKHDCVTMQNGKGRIIARLVSKPNTDTVYILRSVPVFRGQKPLSAKAVKKMTANKNGFLTMFSKNFKRPMYKYAKIEHIGNGKTKYCVVVGQKDGATAYRMVYGAEVKNGNETIVRSALTYKVVAKITSDNFGTIAIFHISTGVDVAAVLAIEQAIYAKDAF